MTTASVCMNEEKATALISRILNTVTVFGLSSKSTSYKPQNRTGYPSFAILVSIVVIPLTFVLLMYSFFLKVHLGEWKREWCPTTSFKSLLCLQLNRLFIKGRNKSGMRRPSSNSNIVVTGTTLFLKLYDPIPLILSKQHLRYVQPLTLL